ncbi:MAG: metallophosphoesterase [Planctomycetota bacterium]
MPFYVVLGNHDHKGSVQAQVDYSQRLAGGCLRGTTPRGEVLADGTRGWGFSCSTPRSCSPGRRRARPSAWLAEALAQSEADWKVACGHHPIYSSKLTREGYRTHLGPFLEDTLVEGGVDLYLAGHDHVLELSQDLRGVRHVISGAGAGWDKAVEIEWGERSDYAATGGGFCVLRFTARDVTLEFVRLDGATQFASTLERAGR